MKRLSSAGAQLLLEDQRNWLHSLADECPIAAAADEQNRIKTTDCLSKAYSYRIGYLKATPMRLGPFLVISIGRSSVIRVEKNFDTDTGLAHQQVSFPQIDQPRTATTARWNAITVQTFKRVESEREEGCDTDVYYDFGVVTARLTSVTWTNSAYCHGTPHGHWSATVENVILLPAPHSLQPADLFRMDLPWRERLTMLALGAIRTDVDRHKEWQWSPEKLDKQLSSDKEVVAQAAADPHRWFLSADGLELIFGTYDLGMGYCCNPKVVVAWSQLRDLMISNPPVP